MGPMRLLSSTCLAEFDTAKAGTNGFPELPTVSTMLSDSAQTLNGSNLGSRFSEYAASPHIFPLNIWHHQHLCRHFFTSTAIAGADADGCCSQSGMIVVFFAACFRLRHFSQGIADQSFF